MRGLTLTVALALFALPAWGEFAEPPTITVIETERLVSAVVNAESTDEENEATSQGAGPFVRNVSLSGTGDHGNVGEAFALQRTTISSFSIGGSGSAFASATGPESEDVEFVVGGLSSLFVGFTIPVAAPYTLSGQFTADGESPGVCLSNASVSLLAVLDNTFLFGKNHAFNCSSDPGDAAFLFTGDIPAGTELFLTITADASRGVGPFFALIGEGAATFDFNLDFGDRDGDGLLDEWEENGIDFGGGMVIDLPGMGADPDHKDLFVEVDVMSGVPFDPAVVSLLQAAFASAPEAMVGNPDGQPGINLHVIYDDGDVIPFQAMAGTQSEVFAQLAAIKQTYFGSAAERSHLAASVIKQARALIFRYALWADTLALEDLPLPVGAAHTGIGEFIGNDFIVASGHVDDFFSSSDIPAYKLQALAGNFMHELGHTLGLRHGGQDDEHYKPHYLSVMNYSYAFPYDIETLQGTNLVEIFELD